MSTRCQIGFYGKDCEGMITRKPDALIYKHCDGYPDPECGVMSWLVPFYEDFMEHRGNDPEYMAAWCIATICLGSLQMYAEMKAEDPRFDTMQFCYTGVGCCYKHYFHGDIEYYYMVCPEKIYVYDVYDKKIVMTYNKGDNQAGQKKQKKLKVVKKL